MGRLEKHKNPVFLLKLSKYLKSYYGLNIEIQFIGSGPERNFFRRYFKKTKNLNKISWSC